MRTQTAAIIPGKRSRWTDAQLMALPEDGFKYELFEGDLYMSPVGLAHTTVCIRLLGKLIAFVEKRNLGIVCDSSMGFRLSPKILLSPDVSFVSHARLKQIMIAPEKFLYGAPDLAVEVLSPHDLKSMVAAKRDKYFKHGTRLVWIIDPQKRAVSVHSADSEMHLTRLGDSLDGGEVLPGFKCKLREILAFGIR